MGHVRILVLALLVTAAPTAFAQPPAPERLTSLQASLLCGPPPTGQVVPAHPLRVTGAQDTVARQMFNQRDLLVINSGTNAGVQLGQEFFVRRGIRWGMPYGARPQGVSTVAWIRVVAVNNTTAIASVQHACDAILLNDYLEPFVMPAVLPGTEQNNTAGELDFTTLAHIVVGAENRRSAATGDLMVMDRGADQRVAPGTRFAIYRDLRRPLVAGYRDPRIPDLPLAAVGEAVVMTVGATTSVVRVTQTRDAVRAGDYLVPRK